MNKFYFYIHIKELILLKETLKIYFFILFTKKNKIFLTQKFKYFNPPI